MDPMSSGRKSEKSDDSDILAPASIQLQHGSGQLWSAWLPRDIGH